MAGKVFVVEDDAITYDRGAELLQYRDEAPVPEVGVEGHNRSFTVVGGQLLAAF